MSLWEVTRADVDVAKVRERMRPVLAGEVDLAARLALDPAHDDVPARVTVLPQRSETATLLEVRAHDRRGLVWTVCDDDRRRSATPSGRPTSRRTAPRRATSSTSSTPRASRSTDDAAEQLRDGRRRRPGLTCMALG